MSDKKGSESKKKKRLIIIIIIICIIALLAGGAIGLVLALGGKDTDFEVKYEVDVPCTVSAKLQYGDGLEKVLTPIVFKEDNRDEHRPPRPNPPQPQTKFEFGRGYRFGSSDEQMTFTYTFTNDDDIEKMKVTLVDESIKDNVRIIYTVRNGNQTTSSNPDSGFIVNPGETWSVECQVSVLNPNKSATYLSNKDNSFTWVIVGLD